MAEIHSRRVDRNQVGTWIEDDLVFEGNVRIMEDIINICGRVSGTIEAFDDVHISKNSVVIAEITCKKSVYILGEVRGNINAGDRVELAAESSLDGDILTNKMVIENGCYFNGTCRMRNDN